VIKRFALMARKKRLTPTTPNSRQSQIASFSKRQNKNSSPFLQLAPQKVKCRGGGSALSHSYPAITGASSPINSSDGRDSTNKSIHRASLSSDSPGSLDSSSSSTPIVTNNEATQDGNTTASSSTCDASGTSSSHYSSSGDAGEAPTNDDSF
jgi:hypothetical protein